MIDDSSLMFYSDSLQINPLSFFLSSAPAASTGGFSFGSALGAAAAPPASTANTTPSLGLGGGLFAQKPAGGLSFNTPAQTNTIPQAQFTPGMKIYISCRRSGSDLTVGK